MYLPELSPLGPPGAAKPGNGSLNLRSAVPVSHRPAGTVGRPVVASKYGLPLASKQAVGE